MQTTEYVDKQEQIYYPSQRETGYKGSLLMQAIFHSTFKIHNSANGRSPRNILTYILRIIGPYNLAGVTIWFSLSRRTQHTSPREHVNIILCNQGFNRQNSKTRGSRGKHTARLLRPAAAQASHSASNNEQLCSWLQAIQLAFLFMN